MKKLLLLLILSFFYLNVQGQNVEIQTFTYESVTRDTVIEFPSEDHNKWERIWMLYSMRCKDGLVSPPQAGLTNLGCGEWDYSCNTNIVDSTLVDSVMRTAPSHVISNFNEDVFNYTSSPTYTYYLTNQHNVTYSNILNEQEFLLNDGTESSDILEVSDNSSKKLQLVLTAADMTASGMAAGEISGLKLNVKSGSGQYSRFKVKVKNFSGNLECQDKEGFTQVFSSEVNLSATDNFLRFYNNFDWDGNSDLLFELSFTNGNGDLELIASAVEDGIASIIVENNEQYIHSSGTGGFSIANGLETINKEITIALWQYGDSNLPVNSTLLEGVDGNGNRMVNIHLPWSNGQVYWDCGNDGSGYDRLNKQATNANFKDQWNHWAFTKNTATGQLRIYLNGALWVNSTGNFKEMNITRMNILQNINKNNKNYGRIDDLSIWNKALNGDDIANLICNKLDDSHPFFENLIALYTFDEVDNSGGSSVAKVIDHSSFENDADVEGFVSQGKNYYFNINKGSKKSNIAPSVVLVMGEYDKSDNEIIVIDSIQNNPNKVDYYEVINNDLVLVKTDYLYEAKDQAIFDENGGLVGYNSPDAEGSITINTLDYFSKTPMVFEIMSFVTPYGINLDLGMQGKTWTFDVTDFGPVLKGKKRIYLNRGGQWQEDMDIKFVFVEGTPARPVKSIQQIWPVTSENYITIQADNKFEPRMITKHAEDAYVITKTTITGHGQEGEFIPRNHYISVDGIPFTWQVWKECADNPIYPQGGTWVYDRAGWCPGAASDTYVADFTYYFIDEEPAEIDYGINGGSGDSRYIVNSQIIKYGEASFQTDAAVEDIIYPSTKIEYGRFNPNCGQPTIKIKNNGLNNLANATIEYGIEGGQTHTYQWSGNLDFLETREVELPYLEEIAQSSEERVFYAKILNPNGGTDEYANNDRLTSIYQPVDMYEKNIIINLKTNSANSETGYKVYDEDGNVILSRGPFGLSSNTQYFDTLSNLKGCYKILVNDSGDDGLDWWANNDGQGFLRLRSTNSPYRTIATDFGKFIDYNFVAGEVSANDDLEFENFVDVYPNPFYNNINVVSEGTNSDVLITIYDQVGREIFRRKYANNNLIFNQNIELDHLKNGLYFVSIKNDRKETIKKVVKLD